MTFTFCVAQLNLVVGDMPGNVQQILDAARQAHSQGASLLVTPELSICGYAAEDLFLRPAFIAACDHALDQLRLALADLKGLSVIVGHPRGGDQRSRSVTVPVRSNSVSVLCEGQVIASYDKQELPNYQVFDERRYFRAGHETTVFEIEKNGQRLRVGLLICEDAWFEAPARHAAEAGAQVLVVVNASPFHLGKGDERELAMRERVRACGLPLVYAHLVGGQDEVVFEGRSFALNADGSLAARAPSFEPCLLALTVQAPSLHISGAVEPERDADADLWDALVLGIRDYVGKNGFPSVLLGLSGGIDSALVLALAVDALGPDRVRVVMMPSPYTADISCTDARDMAQRVGVRYDEISIWPAVQAFQASLAPDFAGLKEDATEENIQARIRGVLLMALSNKFGSLVLTTGNKSEMATGYCTLYGDMAGGFAAIKDLRKTVVFRLAHWRNAHNPHQTCDNPIPQRILTRPPSAELRPDQTDQDSLPPYEVLDAILELYMENDSRIEDILAAGFSVQDVERVTSLLKNSEYKRRQAPPGIRVTHRSFGKDWRYPITNKFRA